MFWIFVSRWISQNPCLWERLPIDFNPLHSYATLHMTIMAGVDKVSNQIVKYLKKIAQIVKGVHGKRKKIVTINKYLHTYIIGHYKYTVRIIDLVSHTTYVNFIPKWRDLQLTTATALLRNFSWQFYLLTEFLTEICWQEIAFATLFWHLSWCSNPGFYV